MKTYKKEIRKVVDDVICDCCGNSTTTMNIGPAWANIGATWGYGSIHDGMEYDIDLCENCFYDTVKFLKDKRSEIRPASSIKIDPLDGESYI